VRMKKGIGFVPVVIVWRVVRVGVPGKEREREGGSKEVGAKGSVR